jgi:hypothetical protein
VKKLPRLRAYLEVTPKKTFAGAVDWPGWERSGRDADAALAKLVDYGPRYARVLARSRLGFEAPGDIAELDVGERVKGTPTTEFGAPAVGPKEDAQPVDGDDLTRLTRILEASWRSFDRAAEAAVGVTLRTGPRGGGRSREKMIEHVMGAEEGYLNALGARPPKSSGADDWPRLREAILAALSSISHGAAPANPSATKKPWTPRFFVRRAAWHALDHAWELEDRSAGQQASDGSTASVPK